MRKSIMLSMAVLCIGCVSAIAPTSDVQSHGVLAEEYQETGDIKILPVSAIPVFFGYDDMDYVVSVGLDFQQVECMQFLRESTKVKFSEVCNDDGSISVGYYFEAYGEDGTVSEKLLEYVIGMYCDKCDWVNTEPNLAFKYAHDGAEINLFTSDDGKYAHISIFGKGKLGEDESHCKYVLAEE